MALVLVATYSAPELQRSSQRLHAQPPFEFLPGWCQLHFVNFGRRRALSPFVQVAAAGPYLLFLFLPRPSAILPKALAPPLSAPLGRWWRVGAAALARPAGGRLTSQFAISLSATAATSIAASEFGERIKMGV